MQEQFQNLIEYLHSVWLRRKWIIIATWVICPLGWAVVTIWPNQYTVEARVYADTRSILQPLLKGLAIPNDSNQELSLMVKTLLSRQNLETIARYTDADLKATTNEEYEDILAELKENIEIKSAGRENLFSISYSGTDPVYVKNVVQSALDVFVENTLGKNRQDTDKASEFIARQLSDYEKRLADAELKLADFKREHAGYLPSSEMGFRGQLDAVNGDIEDTQLELQESRTQLETAKRKLNEEMALAAKNQGAQRTEYDDRLDALQVRLDSLLFRFTDKHPDVKETKRQIAELERQKREWLALSTDDGNSDFRSTEFFQNLKLLISQLENEVASLQVREKAQTDKALFLEDKLVRMPDVEAQLTGLTRSYDITKNKYEELLSRRESALISQKVGAASDDITFRVVDPPRAPLKPSGPIRPLFLVLVLIAGLGVGVALAFLTSQLYPVATSANQLYQLTGIPVLGGVSPTEQSGLAAVARKEKWRFVWVSTALVVCFLGFMALNVVTSIHTLIMQEMGWI
ncbi:GNVR domain-containing protein [Photobacterium sp. SP02]|uniref:XrtA system polysaccharide chain length determinant n=1 Tax=Photobacterium sp. SP02 TaxID=3032280 RepID=UPI003144E346